ncbi:prephenate dehydrogenase [Nocardioides daejeonensis]|uniref:prephenate dehydrogenase n=1 Tax=Nocardioides daejeonensis TaxID=1046556 RepID=UPI000D740CFC|nr:prephenate dehydrogenase [Nocardioides daejeonensis]
MPARALTGPVRVIGAGLLGTSVALACRRAGLEVLLVDVASEHVRTATGLGAGRADDGTAAQLVVVAVPPDHLGAAIAGALVDGDAIVTDVGSIKSQPLVEVRDVVPPDALARYVGGHPMAGSERSGPLAASATLFEGRPWAITPHDTADPAAVALVRDLVDVCGAVALEYAPDEHDLAVARVSHLPHLMSSLVAGRLAQAPVEHLALSGQGVRDVTRIAGSDPSLWKQIIAGNATALLGLLDEVAARLADLRGLVEAADSDALAELLAEGVAGTRAIPGKHGGPVRPMTGVYVAVPDRPGELARLFADAGEGGFNIEDMHMDHDPGREVGLLEIVVATEQADALAESLAERGWVVHP